GRYTEGALAAQADDDPDAVAVDVNIRRVVERHRGAALSPSETERAAVEIAAPLTGRDRLLALMDLGALVCRARAPACGEGPLAASCASRDGPHAPLARAARRTAPYRGSFRQRRGLVLARLREAPQVPAAELDAEAVASLVADGLA